MKTVYVQKPNYQHQGTRTMYYMCCEDIEELHRFATLIGVTLQAYREHPNRLYELTIKHRQRAIERGAMALDDQKFHDKVKFLNQQRKA